MGAQNKPIQQDITLTYARILMIKSPSVKISEFQPQSKNTVKKFKYGQTDFKAKFKNFDFQLLQKQSGDFQGTYRSKQKMLESLARYFAVTQHQLFVFYCGHAAENGDWLIQTLEKPEGQIISFQQILGLWKEKRASIKACLYIFIDCSHSGSWCKRLQNIEQRSMSIYASCSQDQINKADDSSLFMNCLLCNSQEFAQNYKQLTKYQNPIFINNSNNTALIKQYNMKMLHYSLYNATKMESYSQKFVRIYENGQRYEGQLLQGVKNGKGILYNIEGKIVYEGDWQNNMVNGKGTMYYDDETKYKGMWRNNQKHGFGIKYYANGLKYFEGIYMNNKANGKGILYYINGNKKYQGDFVNNKNHGKGIKYYENGNVLYQGDFYQNQFHGKGTQFYETGTIKYEGDFIKNQYNGKGALYSLEELVYEGQFYNGMFHGQGIQYYVDGQKKYEGEFRNNKKNGQGIYYFQDGDRYEGQFNEDKRNGFGICYYSNGKKMYEGQCLNGYAHGRGIRYYDNGEKYDGEWRLNLKNGKGILYDCMGNVKFQGIWQNDNFVN